MNAELMEKKFSLSASEVEDFHRTGYAGPFTVYEPDEMREHFKALRPELADNKKSIYSGSEGISGVTNLVNYDRHMDVSFLAEHICRTEIVDRVASILGKDVLCWRTEFFPKYPGDEGTDWHQAGTFANVGDTKKAKIVWPPGSEYAGSLTVWTAFTESTIENGCLQFVPGTHRTMFYDESKTMTYSAESINSVEKEGTRRGFFGYDYRQLQIDPNWKPDESKAVNLIMKPGQFMMFWSTLLHGSHAYKGKTGPMRLGYSARYVPTKVQVYPGMNYIEEFGANASLEKHGSVLVSGQDRFGHNKLARTTVNNFPFRCQP